MQYEALSIFSAFKNKTKALRKENLLSLEEIAVG